ncbi:MAG: hypothetical protein H0W25_19685 [Acidimicrobiia bacterium]|nr:hypothetical protein [Acidimicrobiia bacterium]
MAAPEPVLDPIAVLRRLVGSPAYVMITFGPGSEARGSVLACDDAVTVLIDHDATASFVLHEAVVAVTVRDAHAFGDELELPRPAEALPVPMSARVTDAVTPAALGALELEQLMQASGFEYDRSAAAGLDVRGRTGLATLASAVGTALQSIQADQAADAAMTKDVTHVRLEDGPMSRTTIEGTTLVVMSPWSGGPSAVYDPARLRADILAAGA